MQFKKLVAGALGALMVGATAGLSATLADYPAPFAKDGSLNAVVVVGADAKTEDVVGAINLGARLASESYKLTTGGTTTGTVSGGSVYSKDVPFNTNIGAANQFKNPLKNFDVTALKSGSLTFDGASYNWEESFTAASSSTLQVETSASTGGNKDMKDTPYLRYGLGDLAYNWTFTTAFNASAVSASKPLTINILGKTFKLTSLGVGNMTASVADEKFLKSTESYKVGTQTVKLVDVASSAVVVDVDGESKTISSGSTETVNGLQVKVVSVFYKSDDTANSGATLQAGSDISKTYNTGDAFPGEDKDNPNWVWDLAGVQAGNSAAKHTLKVKFNKNVNLVTDTPAPLAPGQSLQLPNNYLKFGFDSVTTHNVAQYKIEYVSAVDISNAFSGNTTEAVIKLSTSVNDGFTVTSNSAKTKTIYLAGANSTNGINVAYVDQSTSKVLPGGNYTNDTFKLADIVFQDTTLAVYYSGAVEQLNVTQPSGAPTASGNITINATLTSGEFVGFNTANSAEASDLTVLGTEMGTRDEDVLTDYGIKIRAPKSSAGSDRVVLDVPSTQLKAFLSLKAGSGSTSSGSTSGQIKEVVPVKAAIAKLDTDARTDVTTKNAILVGGPCVNDLVEELAKKSLLKRSVTSGNTTTSTDLTCTGWVAMKENFGIISVVDNAFATGYSALVVAGTDAKDTTLGTQILQDYETYASRLKGNQVEYSGASLAAVTFK